MHGDQTGGLPQVVVSMSTLQPSIRTSYSYFIDTQFYTEKTKGVEVIQTMQISNGDTAGLLIPVQVEATMTELPHVAVTLTPTTYNRYIELIAHNVSDFGKVYDINYVSTEILDNLTIVYDRQVFNGTMGSGGELLNYGLFTNPYVVSVTPAANIEVVDDLSALMETLKNNVVNATGCLDSDVVFVFTGTNTRAFLRNFSGDFFKTNASIISDAYPNNPMYVLPVIINNTDQIFAFCYKKVKGHSTGLPTLYNQGRSQGDKYYSYYHFSKGSYGVEMKQQGVAYKQGLTFNVTVTSNSEKVETKPVESTKKTVETKPVESTKKTVETKPVENKVTEVKPVTDSFKKVK